MTIVDPGPITGPIRSGRARAVTSEKRVATMPDVSTVLEAGLPGLVVKSWAGLYAPAKTPPAVLRKIEAEVMRVAEQPELRQILANRKTETAGTKAAALVDLTYTDRARFSAIAREFNTKLDE